MSLSATPSCSHPDGRRLGVIIAVNGAKHIKLCCHICGHLAGGRVAGNPDHYPVVRDNRTGAICEHCGSTDGVETHHWAPTALFDDPEGRWPMSLLCPPCHRLWHSVVTPGMRRST